MKKPKLAVLTDFPPHIGGLGKPVIQKLLRLSADFEVHLITLYNHQQELPLPSAITLHRLNLPERATSKDALSIPSLIKKAGIRGIFSSLSNALNYSFPLYYGAFIDAHARRCVKCKIKALKPDALLTFRYVCAELSRSLEHVCPIFMDIGDRISIYHSSIIAHPSTSFARKTISLIESFLFTRYEQSLSCRASAVFYISKRDLAAGKKLSSQHCWPLLMDSRIPRLKNVKKDFDILLLGNWSTMANADSLHFAIKEIFPLCKHHPKVALLGPGADEALLASSKLKIENLGFVKDLDSALLRSKALLAPIRLASGVQTKVLDCLKMGLATIVSKNAKGGVNPPANSDAIIVCSNADEFAVAIDAMAQDEKDYSNTAQKAYAEYAKWAQDSQEAAIKLMLKKIKEKQNNEKKNNATNS
ncbi:hypothetical protein COU37_05680 [Candidatus Micrarchaeota archaeon CG10_big_fil_rev_8_21_14_0_10_45_29]|nr:MAG: hypothetical protein COU37_05680 [Candidatus Micrarchaeota archaeon CG10_big_fil_rev_8_21_14_0_10_45_29]